MIRFRQLAMLCFLTACVAAAPAEAATAPPPSSCTAVLTTAGTSGSAGDLAATAAVVNATVTIECERDPLTTPPIDHVTGYTGSLSLFVYANGVVKCEKGAVPFNSVSSVLVMRAELQCVIPVGDPDRTGRIEGEVGWATSPPYSCCSYLRGDLNTVKTKL